MKTKTILPVSVIEAATKIHLSLKESNFYAEECQVVINEDDVIEFIGCSLLPTYLQTGECLVENLNFEELINGLIAFTVLESLKDKNMIGSIDIDGEECYFLKKSVRDSMAELS